MKWFEEVGQIPDSNFISSRIRLARNWEEYAFPSKLSIQEGSELVGRLTYGLDDIGKIDNTRYTVMTFDRLPDIDKFAFKERRLFNAKVAESKLPMGLIYSDREDVSIILNGDDHIRIQMLMPGLNLSGLWSKADKLDDYINERFKYAFDEKYGYLTSYPTNVGTGMRANAVVHLPILSLGKQFPGIIEGMGRFGVTIKGVFGSGRENFGALYDISNTKTLGQSEKDIADMVSRVAMQLNDQENQLRKNMLENHRLERQDEAYKSYGVLRYARRLSQKDSLIYLSHLRAGIVDGLIAPSEEKSIYKLMLEVQPYNLMKMAARPLDTAGLDEFRAEYIRSQLPAIKENYNG